ncbi:MAG: restriction endonuclease subunit S [Pseudohongiella sp.]|nr:restriction endonuclease subunit S [Pseudohongiella sp.]
MSTVDLPEGWCRTILAEIAEWGSGGTPSRREASYFEGNIPWVKTGDLGPKVLISASEHISELAVQNSSAKCFPKGSVVIAMYGATIGKTSILGIDATTNQACGVGNPIEGLTVSEFVYYFLLHEKDYFIAKGKGGAQPNISQALIKEHVIALPPLAEQKIIADKLNTLLAQVETTKVRLERIPEILKAFRQSVLAAAVSGRLSEGWRSAYGQKERKFTTEPELTEFQGRTLPILPVTWQWLKFNQVADIASNLISPLDNPEAIHIAPNHIESWTGVVLSLQTVSEDGVTSAKHRFTKGQIIYSKIRPYLAKVTIADFDGLCSADMYPINSRINSQFLFYWMITSEFTEWASNAESRSVLPKINQKDLSRIPVPTPPIEEQTEIVSRIVELFTLAKHIEQKAIVALARVNNLNQSILAKAFCGELTADWRTANIELISGKNSAEALLARIKEERNAMKPETKMQARKQT